MAVRVIRVLEYTYPSLEFADRDMARWMTHGTVSYPSGETIRSTAIGPYPLPGEPAEGMVDLVEQAEGRPLRSRPVSVTISVDGVRRQFELSDDLGQDPRALRDAATGAVAVQFENAWREAVADPRTPGQTLGA